ncbi:ornithine carbamoyltransferase [Iodidimonas sp. SYSU 1G8]|uniref:ornithine carbamoyltransferase n=1 Tax=Iodidimonas sp. SYSU 1G8 TaxID=3133967 RepID=UPI0031FF40CC
MTGGAYRHFLDLDQIDASDLRQIIDRAKAIKNARAGLPKGAADPAKPLNGEILAAIFERESTRTRVSFDVGMRQLGGQTMVLTGDETQLGRGETVADTARVLSRFVDVLMLRTLRHDYLLELAEHATIPVINGLTQLTHPCQLMADVMTMEEHRGPVAGKVAAWTGDGNNVCASLVHAAVKFDFELRIATPPEYALRQDVLDWAAAQGGRVSATEDPHAAVKDADFVFTDTFVSMGQTGREQRLERLDPYRISEAVMATAKPDALFLHCLPAHRGEEVDEAVIDGPQSVVWDEAENRLHVQKAILLWCLGK